MAALGGVQAAEGSQAFSAFSVAQRAAVRGELLELTGERGEPRPQVWKAVFVDPSARGGIREVEVTGGAVSSLRTPVQGYAPGGVPIPLTRLKIDSDAAFEKANKLAIAQRLSFHWVDYTLRANQVTGAPMWVLRLYDNMGAQVGVMQISADNGEVIRPLEVADAPRRDEPTRPPPKKVGGVIGKVTGVVERTATNVSNATLRAVGTVQETLTGDRTIGPREEEE